MSQVRPHFDEWWPSRLPPSLSAFWSTYLGFFLLWLELLSFRKICQREGELKVCLVLTLQTLPWISASKVHQKSNVNFGEFNVNLNPGWVSKHIHQRYLILMIIIILCFTTLNIMINDSDSNILIISHPQTFNNSLGSECYDVSGGGEGEGGGRRGDWLGMRRLGSRLMPRLDLVFELDNLYGRYLRYKTGIFYTFASNKHI